MISKIICSARNLGIKLAENILGYGSYYAQKRFSSDVSEGEYWITNLVVFVGNFRVIIKEISF